MVKRLLALVSSLAALVLAAGRSPKSPSCAETVTTALVRNIVLDYAASGFEKLRPPRKELAELAKRAVKLQLMNIRTEGYDDKARKHVCMAALTMRFERRLRRALTRGAGPALPVG